MLETERYPSWAAAFPAEGDTVIAGIERTNPASARVLEKEGFSFFDSTDSQLRYRRGPWTPPLR